MSFSGAEGAFAVIVPGGQTRLRVTAPGLRAMGSTRQGNTVIVVMGVDAHPDEVVVADGYILRFDPSDSVDPDLPEPGGPSTALLQLGSPRENSE